MKYTKEHLFIKRKKNIVEIGMTKEGLELLGEIAHLSLPNVGSFLQKDEVMGIVESMKSAIDLYAPLSGKVLEVNKALLENPSLIKKPTWWLKMELTKLEEYEALFKKKVYLNEKF